MTTSPSRNPLRQARRVVIKVGTRVLVDSRGRPRPERIQALVDQIAALHTKGIQTVLVSSGAVGAGLDPLGMANRPKDLVRLQMAAAVGQTRLMSLYGERFQAKGISVGQILLNHDDLKNRSRHLNARNTLLGLLHQGVIPIVNENDVVSVDEIRLGDNDTLAALVSVLVDADVLVLCTTVNGLRKPTGSANRTERIPHLTKVDGQTLALTQGKGSALSTGGMATKLQAAATAGQAGVMSLIVDGRRPDTLRRALAGEDIGTWVVPPQATNRVRGKRKHWIAFFHKPQGRLQVDTGAEKALQTQGKSLLPVGIQKITGQFEPGAVVEVANQRGHVFASGLSAFSSSDLERILGLKSSEIPERLGPAVSTEVIHRDNLVLYSPTGSSHAEIH